MPEYLCEGILQFDQMNQQCKVCGEPAAGFHFGAFTCEGCKSFFGRSYNNLSSITECKNNSACIINKKNRTACKACRLRKCLMVGMSKSGSRYGRRSNWFKIHCLLQEQQTAAMQAANQNSSRKTPSPHERSSHERSPSLPNQPMHLNGINGLNGLSLLQPPFPHPALLHLPRTRDELAMMGYEEYRRTTSPSISSPESHRSDSSNELDVRRPSGMPPLPFLPGLLPPHMLPPPGMFFPHGYPGLYPNLLPPTSSYFGRNAMQPLSPSNSNKEKERTEKNERERIERKEKYHDSEMKSNDSNNNNNPKIIDSNHQVNKRIFLDAVLSSQRSPMSNDCTSTMSASPPMSPESTPSVSVSASISASASPNIGHSVHSLTEEIQENPIDLSMKGSSERSAIGSPSSDRSGSHSISGEVTPTPPPSENRGEFSETIQVH